MGVELAHFERRKVLVGYFGDVARQNPEVQS
jgi:hypothetical protein